MSGRGRYNQGGRGNHTWSRGSGRHSGWSRGRFNSSRGSGRTNSNSNNNFNNEMKFVPHYSGRQQTATYDTVRDHIIQQIQKTFKHGIDMAKAIWEMKYDDASLVHGKSVRELVIIPSDKTTRDE